MPAQKAASFARLIEETLNTRVVREKGKRGQFEVWVDGAMVLSRKGGLIAMLVKRPWPSDREVLAAVREARSRAGS